MIGVNIAIIQDNSLLLTQREDFEVWYLPGGVVEPGETLAQAAMRKAKEETRLDAEPALVIQPSAGPATDLRATRSLRIEAQ